VKDAKYVRILVSIIVLYLSILLFTHLFRAFFGVVSKRELLTSINAMITENAKSVIILETCVVFVDLKNALKSEWLLKVIYIHSVNFVLLRINKTKMNE
jgi:hypothetical protein